MITDLTWSTLPTGIGLSTLPSHFLRYIWYVIYLAYIYQPLDPKMRPSKKTPVEELWTLSGISESDKGTEYWSGTGTFFWEVYLVLVHALATCIWYAYHSITPHSRTIPICHIQYPGPCTHLVYPCTDPCTRYILMWVPAPSTCTHPYPERTYLRTVPLIKACTHIPYPGTHGTAQIQSSTTATSLRTVPVPVHKSHHPVPIRRLR